MSDDSCVEDRIRAFKRTWPRMFAAIAVLGLTVCARIVSPADLSVLAVSNAPGVCSDTSPGWWPQCGCPNPSGSSDVITSPFGPRDNGGYLYDYHPALDIGIPLHGVVHAIADGLVKPKEQTDDGFLQRIDSYVWSTPEQKWEEFTAVYLHLESVFVAQGQAVQKGQVIGKIGLFPPSTGPHVHLETWPKNDKGRRSHPLRYLTWTDQGCPGFDSVTVVGQVNDAMWLDFASLSPKSDRYDLVAIRVYLFFQDDIFLKGWATEEINFENMFQMEVVTPHELFFGSQQPLLRDSDSATFGTEPALSQDPSQGRSSPRV